MTKLIAALVLTVAACGGSSKNAPTTGPGTGSAMAATCDPATKPAACPGGGDSTCKDGSWACHSIEAVPADPAPSGGGH